ncbi:motility associated factor glycosyltransferase family protein [Shewanella sp. GXUN23E]|uniref:motility associated factor glycosyltransferase family protein n=1 Tax=Shewanella sp. GXUN23E TaxID=3422498 RepID=UPI003D7D48D6
MTDLLQLNLQVIAQRWPAIAGQLAPLSTDSLNATLVEGLEQTISINGLQLSSRHGRIREAALLCSQVPRDTESLHLYGTGMGDVAIYLLENHPLQSLYVHLMNLKVFKLLLTYTNQSEWLSDPRVQLIATPDSDYPKQPNIAIPPELALCDEDYSVVRDMLVYELNREHVNHNRSQQIDRYKHRLASNRGNLQADADVSVMTADYHCQQALVIAAGPSLEEHYQALLQISKRPRSQRPLLIAVDTAVKGLHSKGIQADVIVTVDELITAQIINLENCEGCALVYMAKTDPELIAHWPGPRFNAHSDLPRDDKLAADIPKTRLFLNGSVVHPAIHLALLLGAQDITLIGADFGYVGKKAHAFWQPNIIGGGFQDTGHRVLDGHGGQLPTALNLRAYLRALEHFIRKYPHIKFYRASLNGADIKGTTFRALNHD